MIFALLALAASVPKIVKKDRPKNDVDCTMCQFGVSYIESMLSDQQSIDQITKQCEQMCLYVEEDVRDICDAIVEEYIPQIIEYIRTEMSSMDICKELGICK